MTRRPQGRRLRSPSLPEAARRALRLRLNNVAVALVGCLRANVHDTDKVEAVHEYLSRAEGVVTLRAVQRYLKNLSPPLPSSGGGAE